MEKKKDLLLVGIRMDPQLKQQLRALAAQDQRTFSNYLVKLLTEHVQQKNKPRRNGLAAHHEAVA